MSTNKKYYNDIVRIFPIHSKKEKLYLQNLKEEINEYENVAYDDLVNEFGSPIDVVKAYYDTIDSQYLLKKIKTKRIIEVSCILIIVLVMIVSFRKIYLYEKAYEEFRNSIPAEIEETIEE